MAKPFFWAHLEKPLRPNDYTLDRRGGHPTAPGPNDEYVARMGSHDVDFGSGKPGVPRIQPGPHHRENLPGEFGRPIQPETFYDTPE